MGKTKLDLRFSCCSKVHAIENGGTSLLPQASISKLKISQRIEAALQIRL
jgi:hypothetical protein